MIRTIHYAFNAITLFAQGRIRRRALWFALAISQNPYGVALAVRPRRSGCGRP